MQIGDKVSYIVTRKIKNGYIMSQKEGVLIQKGENFSIVKSKNGRKITLKNEKITSLKVLLFKDEKENV